MKYANSDDANEAYLDYTKGMRTNEMQVAVTTLIVDMIEHTYRNGELNEDFLRQLCFAVGDPIRDGFFALNPKGPHGHGWHVVNLMRRYGLKGKESIQELNSIVNPE